MSRRAMVFVVDDDLAVRDSTQLLLESAAFTVRSYSSAEEFLSDFHPELLERAGAGGAPVESSGEHGKPRDSGLADPELVRCLLLDVRMAPGMSGLELQRLLFEAQVDMRIIFLTAHGDVPMAVGVVKAGACDFLEKPVESTKLIDCVRQALDQDAARAASRKSRAGVMARYESLTPRETQVLELVVAGRANKVTASVLGIGEKTVETHRLRLMRKMTAESIPDLIRMLHIIEKIDPGKIDPEKSDS